MEDKCYGCEYEDTCELAHEVSFCEDCKDFDNCDILEMCDGGEYIECNNGFEPIDFDDDDEEDEYKIEPIDTLFDYLEVDEEDE